MEERNAEAIIKLLSEIKQELLEVNSMLGKISANTTFTDTNTANIDDKMVKILASLDR